LVIELVEGVMKVGDLVKRRDNGDLALVVRLFEKSDVPAALWDMGKDGFMELFRIACGSIQHGWIYEYEVINESR
jgi:hypothetical protein